MGVKVDQDMQKKRIILIGLVIIAIIIIAIIVAFTGGDDKNKEEQGEQYKEVLDDGETTLISSEKLTEEREYEGLTISNVKFEIGTATTFISADVINNSGKKTDEQHIDVHLLDKKGEEVQSLLVHVRELQPGETTKFSSTILSTERDHEVFNISLSKREVVEGDENNLTPDENSDTNNETNNENQNS